MTEGTMELRIVSENDAEELLNIYAPYVRDTAISFEYQVPSAAEFRRRIRSILRSYPYIAAIEDGKIRGYSYAGAFKEREAYRHAVEMTVYVDRQCRGRGIGTALYAGIEKILIRQGILNLNACIGYTPRSNDPYLTNASMTFHEHEGYHLAGRFEKCGYKFNNWYDMIWMEKLIGEHSADAPVFKSFPELEISLKGTSKN